MDLALFPLNTVLFPGGKLPLRIFEARYVDMIGDCMRSSRPFGVVPITAGSEVGGGADFFPYGTCANIEDFDQGDDGLLHVVARGGQRFKVLDYEAAEDGLISATVDLVDDDSAPLDPDFGDLCELLRQAFESHPEVAPTLPWLFDQTDWVAYRLAELMPLPNAVKLEVLRLNGPTKLATLAELLKRTNNETKS